MSVDCKADMHRLHGNILRSFSISKREIGNRASVVLPPTYNARLRFVRLLLFGREADMLEEYLYNQGFPAISIHGDRSQTEREQALKSFRAGREKVLVATVVCARGIDIPNVAMVVNYDMPNQVT